MRISLMNVNTIFDTDLLKWCQDSDIDANYLIIYDGKTTFGNTKTEYQPQVSGGRSSRKCSMIAWIEFKSEEDALLFNMKWNLDEMTDAD